MPDSIIHGLSGKRRNTNVGQVVWGQRDPDSGKITNFDFFRIVPRRQQSYYEDVFEAASCCGSTHRSSRYRPIGLVVRARSRLGH